MKAIELANQYIVSKSTIVKWIDELRDLDSVITNKMIFNSFTYSGISISLDGSEDKKFRGYEDIQKTRLFKIENDDIYSI